MGLARALGLTAVAEGVESPAQHARLVELGCDMAQGYLWSRPLPGGEAGSWLDGAALAARPSAQKAALASRAKSISEGDMPNTSVMATDRATATPVAGGRGRRAVASGPSGSDMYISPMTRR